MLNLIIEKPPDYINKIKDKIIQKLKNKYSVSEQDLYCGLSECLSKFPELLQYQSLLDFLDQEEPEIHNEILLNGLPIGVSLDGHLSEFSEEYYIPSLVNLRIPVDFKIDSTGIYYKNNLVTHIPYYPTKILIIHGGAFPIFYKLGHLLNSHISIVSDMSNLSFISPKNQKYFKQFISNTVMYSLLTPSKIEETIFE